MGSYSEHKNSHTDGIIENKVSIHYKFFTEKGIIVHKLLS